MNMQVRWCTGAVAVGTLLVCAVAACSNKTEPSPAAAPSTASAGCATALELTQSVVDLKAFQQIRLTVTAPSTCQWALTAPSWVQIVSQYSGPGTYGTGTATFWVQVASATSARQGAISVLNTIRTETWLSVMLYQEDECSFKVSPGTVTFDAAGGRKSVALSTPPGCAWSFDAPAWTRIEPASGTGNATLMIDAEPTQSPRAGSISMAGLSVGVLQTPVGMSPLLAFSNLSCGSLRPGERKTGLCYFDVAPGQNPTSSQIGLAVDLRALGWGDNYTLNPDMGTNGHGFFVDVRIAANVAPGLKAIPLTARDAQGRTATVTFTLSVLPPK